MESDLGGTGTYTVNLSQTASSTTLTALPTATNQITATTSAAGAAQRTLTYRPGGDLAQDIHAGGIAYGYSYNAAKRLVGVTQNGSAAGAYAYDFMSRRVWRETYGSGAAQTAYIYDPQGHLLAEHNASTGAVTREYVWIDDMPVALLDISGSTVTTDFLHTGQIDEPLAVTNSSQALVWNAYIDPYGSANFIGTPTEILDMRLPGQSFQLETSSLSQNGWRDYDPSLGRYVEADPIGLGGGQNLYAYVNGDPLNEVDPLGLQSGNVGHTCRLVSEQGIGGPFRGESICRYECTNGSSVSLWAPNGQCPRIISANDPRINPPPPVAPSPKRFCPIPQPPKPLPWWIFIFAIPFPGNPAFGGA
jgi:RHS repeat-associated protein